MAFIEPSKQGQRTDIWWKLITGSGVVLLVCDPELVTGRTLRRVKK